MNQSTTPFSSAYECLVFLPFSHFPFPFPFPSFSFFISFHFIFGFPHGNKHARIREQSLLVVNMQVLVMIQPALSIDSPNPKTPRFQKIKSDLILNVLHSSFFLGHIVSCHISRLSILLQLIQKLLRRTLSIALGVILGPAPQVLTGIFQGSLGLPSQFAVGPGGVAGQVQDITGTTADDLVGQVSSDGGAECLDHVKDG